MNAARPLFDALLWTVSPTATAALGTSNTARWELRADMTFDWKGEPDRDQAFPPKKKVGGQPNDRYIERTLEELLVQAPQPPPP